MTHLLLMAIDPFIVMVQGHWKSTAFLEYWRLCEEIVLMFIGFSNHRKCPSYQLCRHSNNTSWSLFNVVVGLSGADCQPTLLGLLYMVESPLQPAMHVKGVS